jgi:outer membrane protein assembly factor BamB
MRRFPQVLAALTVAVFVAPLLHGGTPRIAVTAGARDFLAGDGKGVAVSADGRLTLGAALAARAWPDDAADAAVFAAAADGSGRVFVATGGGLGRLFVSNGTSVKLLFTAPEPNVTAVAVAPDGTVYCATSPNGKVYRVDPKPADAAASATVVGDPKEAAIWALAFGKDGTLYAGTGNKGRIYRKTPSGTLELFHEVEDVHIRALAVGPDGTVYAGTSDRGLVVAFPVQGSPRTLHDFSRPEVTGLAVDARGVLYAAASQLDPASGRPAPTDLRLRPSPTPTPAPAGAEEAPRGSVSVSASTSAVRPAVEVHSASSSEIAVIQPDGFVEPGWTFPEESILGIRLDASGALLIATGSRGRVYEWRDRRVRLVASTGEKLALAVPPVGSGFAVVTMGAAGVLRPDAGKPPSGTFTSAVKDASRLSTFGRLRWEGQVPAGAALSLFVRAGNSDKPDATWSTWMPVGADGGARPPVARFFQWKASLTASPKGESPVLERIDLSYTERNARPVLENLALLEPGAVFSRGATGLGVLSVTNPDEFGIYSGLETPRDGAGDGPGKRLFRKGYRTLTWKGTDPNGDTLRYEVEARREESSTWFPVRKDLEDAYLSFDTTALSDGRYRFRVTASDRLSQPESEALTAREETGVVVIDNTPPVLKVESRKVEGDSAVVTILATDALSPVTKAEGAVNADRWRLLPAEDGAADSPTERFVFRVPKPPGPAVLSIRVLDAMGNVAAISVEWPF